jgi:homoserine dehydrogenase
MLKIGIIGVGTVGQSVAQILESNADVISARAGQEIVATKGVVSNLSKKRDVNIELSTDVDTILNDDSIDVVVELMGGIEGPLEVVKKALSKGKAVVTANKALLAYHRYELQDLAGDLAFEYEAAVAGGIPIITALRDGLTANHIESIKGIMNGTCNYMMTKMMNEGVDYDEILQESQDLGYAEADPSFDVGGFDAAHKLLILASIAYGIDAKPEDILIEGIENINQDDISFAKEFGYVIKLLTIAKKVGSEIELRVHPVLIKNDAMIAKIDGVMNAVSVIGDKVGETLYYGPGAGGDATASAVIANLVDIARSGKRSPMLGFDNPSKETFRLKDRETIESAYYLRLLVDDKSGVLSAITALFAEHNISIETVLQRTTDNEQANLLFATHMATEKAIATVMKELESFDFVKSTPAMIRIDS